MEPQDPKPVSDQPDAVANAAPSTQPIPVTQAPVDSQPAEQPAVSMSTPVISHGKGRSGLWIAIAIVAALVLAGGGYVLGFYYPNRPSAVFSSSLDRTGQALDALVKYSNAVAQKHYESYGVNGTLSVKSGAGNYQAKLSGGVDQKANASLKLDADILGKPMSANLRSVHAAGNTAPDIYLQLTGIKPVLDGLGASSLDGVDGQWVVIDHAALQTYAENYYTSLPKSAGTVPTGAQLHDALVKVQDVNKRFLFTTDTKDSVLRNKKFVGKETKDSRSVYHYMVGYDKTHLGLYAGALGNALDSSSLNDWSKVANNGKSLSTMLDPLNSAVESAKGDYTFDVWVDAKTKLVHSVQFSDPSDSSDVFSITQNYTGGNEYPFVLSASDKASDGSTESTTVKLTVNTDTDKDSGSFAWHSSGSDVNFNFDLTPSTSDVQVAAPSNAKSITELLGSLGLGGGSLL